MASRKMFNKLSRKGKNLTDVDNWLDILGYYRKNVAYDETCLFRAVSEQLFDCQVYHERVRKECIAFAEENYELFSHLVTSEKSFHDRLHQLQKHMAVCGILELHIVSLKYECDVIIFDGKKQQQEDVTNYGFSKLVALCLTDDDHYDAIYKKEHIVAAGFCQSIVYKLFYENVFNIQNVDDIVRKMLYEKHNLVTISELMKNEDNEDQDRDPNNNGDYKPSCSLIAPFPFKVAKALDPNIYRNIEYDSWGETRRELRLGEWYYGDDKLIQGTRCIYTDFNNEKYDCYIQEILKDQNMCVIYLTKLASKRTVYYSELSREDDAKPWALPWRFTKNLTISDTTTTTPVDKSIQKCRKRGKDKKRTKSEGNLASFNVPLNSDASVNVNAFIGAPLHMHSPTKNTSEPPNVNAPIEKPSEDSTEAGPIEDSGQNFDRCVWQPPQWPTFIPTTPETYIWSPSSPQPTTPFNFGLKPMIASAPVTPDVIPYHDPRFPFYFNYQVTETQQMYTQWSSNTDASVPCIKSEEIPSEPQNIEREFQKENELNVKTELVNSEESICAVPVTREKPQFNLVMPPQVPTVEVYSPVMPMHPGTPVLYTPTLPEVSEVMMPTSPLLYTPQLDVQYVSPGPCSYIYPPTPPTTWCPPAVNAQGFIFPNH